MSNIAKNFEHNLSVLLIVIQLNKIKYFSDLYPAKMLNLSAKPYLSV